MEREEIKNLIQEVLRNQGGVVPYHIHNGIDSPKLPDASTPFSLVSFSITRDLTTASGAVTEAHGLGTTPTFVRLTGFAVAGSAEGLTSFGTYDGTTNRAIYYSKNGVNLQANGGTGFAVAFVPVGASDYQTGVVTFDDTNVTITWSKVGSPTGSAYIIMEVY